MKRNVLFCFILSGFLCLCACRITINASGPETGSLSAKGSSTMRTEEREVEKFESLYVSNGINVYVSSGVSNRLKVVADDNLIPLVQTQVSDGRLTVRIKEGVSLKNHNGINVYVAMQRISHLKATSGADIKGTVPFTADEVRMEATSAGAISLELTAQHVHVAITSGADITLKGKAETLQASATSGADLVALGFPVRSCAVSLTSGADASVNVTETISYTVTSGADLKCKGKPRVTGSKVTSGGDVVFH